MPTVEERLRQVTLKIKRAKKHIADVDQQLATFLDAKPYGVGSKHDPETRKLVYYVSCVHHIPESIPLIAGDAIQNLMSALDHIAYQIVCSDTLDSPPNPRWIYFPIRDSATEYETAKHRKMQGAHQESFDAIDLLEPYKGGKGELLWVLYSLNNIEKHRLLLTVGAQAGGVHLGQLTAKAWADDGFPTHIVNLFKQMDIFIAPADKGFPLKQGFELLIGAVDEKPDPNQQFQFDIALNEPGIVEGKPLLETLHQLSTLVDGVVVALTSRLKDT